MDGRVSSDAPLDYASFHIWPTQNRYEAFVCCDDKTEKLASGFLEQLAFHLPQLKDFDPEDSDDDVRLQLPENLKGSAWFSKSTLSSFLHIVGVPELLKNANAIGDEMSQLEEARKFHLALYAQGNQDGPRSKEADRRSSEEMELKPELQITSADATKNELLRAMDLRVAALREELVAAFSQAAGGACSCEQIVDLVAFSNYFGAIDLRNSLSKYLELIQKNRDVNPQNGQPKFSQGSGNGNEKVKIETVQATSAVVKPIKYDASPAKAAQVERHSSTESEESSNSSSEDQPYTERSRSLIRSASPRRSASPMRRIQIGRSGSRRAPALTIKSLSYIPAKERISSNKDSDEESNQPLKKPESNASSMSVRDAISLFERKQKDQSSDLQKKKLSADTSGNASKAVLRRWSSGMGDSSSQPQLTNACDSNNEMSSSNLVGEEAWKTPMKVDPDSASTVENASLYKTADESASRTTGEEKVSYSMENLTDDGFAQAAESNTKVAASLDWNRQKEDELNLMMMKMMESKPIRNRGTATGVSRSQELPRGQRGGFYDHYKQKRDEKLRGENSGKRAEKEEKIKSLQGILDQRKVEMLSKSMSVVGKQESVGKPRKSQKNPSSPVQPRKESSKSSSPILQPKKDLSKSAAPKKISPKSSTLPATRKSWPTAPSPKSSAAAPVRTANGISSTGTIPTRRKSQTTPSPIHPSPKFERPQQKPKSTKGPQIDTKPSLKGQEGKKQRSSPRSGSVTEAKMLQSSGDGSSGILAKPSFYNKVTKKGSVVPLESKPFLRKRSGTSPGVGTVKTKVSQSDEPVSCEKYIQVEEAVVETSMPMSQKEEEAPTLQRTDVTDIEQEAPVNSHQICEDRDSGNQFVSESDNNLNNTIEYPIEIQAEDESAISPTAWVEIEEHEELHLRRDSHPPQTASPTNAEVVASSSPRVRHSLSQMLQEDSGEPEIIEWGNAENPPAIVYQKDAAKGLKRLLKFARKSKGEANATGWSSPSVFSEGEEDAEEPKASSKRHADAILRKSSLQAKGFGQMRTSLGASFDGGSSSKTSDYTAAHDLLSGQSNMSKFASHASQKSQEGQISSAASTKATRSFFSLSTFRSSKSNETKLR
ncbi:hypothetical protein AQUCO_00400543v1 [Aquilegia coerulea]|uniref:Uncharacterized protein n=2 Tax=Aquilegia coerulea TaxID=218851 RepID=A0A2G5EVC9_AQUCA|nr:hypothetical protein AQUCO_00400543v1 [Aquilegia coerulea]